VSVPQKLDKKQKQLIQELRSMNKDKSGLLPRRQGFGFSKK